MAEQLFGIVNERGDIAWVKAHDVLLPDATNQDLRVVVKELQEKLATATARAEVAEAEVLRLNEPRWDANYENPKCRIDAVLRCGLQQETHAVVEFWFKAPAAPYRWRAGGTVGSAWTLFEAKQEALAAWQVQESERDKAP